MSGGGAGEALRWGWPRAVGLLYALAIGYGLFALLDLFAFFGVQDPIGLITARNPWNWLSWNVAFGPNGLGALGLDRTWWHGLVANDLRLPLQLIAAFLLLTLAQWVWGKTLARFFP